MIGLILKPGREESLLRKHPWVFSGSISEVVGALEIGSTVDIYSSRGDFMARASYSPHSNIRARVWSWDQDEEIDAAFFNRRIMEAVSLRYKGRLGISDTNALRLIHGESDNIPGLVVDQYKDVVVLQLLTAGVERWRDVIISALSNIPGVKAVYERSDSDVRALEGLEPKSGLQWGEIQEENVMILEGDLSFLVDIRNGHKTGFYLDQRLNRLKVRKLAEDCDVLDCFSYTGGFSLNALLGGASSVTSIDSSEEALAIAEQNIAHNHMPSNRIGLVQADVFRALRLLRDQGRRFDLIILDPPKFAHTQSMAQRAARGYKDINLLAFKLLRPEGKLVTFSCSGGVNAELFQKIVAGAALDAEVNARILAYLHQDADHPVAMNFPEGAYLKGLVILVSS